MKLNLTIEDPLKELLVIDKTQCICYRGVPTRPDYTIIPGLGALPSGYTALEPQIIAINEPSSSLALFCVSLFILLSHGITS
jgi:hypothetical protein